jgi:hypothetical protein
MLNLYAFFKLGLYNVCMCRIKQFYRPKNVRFLGLERLLHCRLSLRPEIRKDGFFSKARMHLRLVGVQKSGTKPNNLYLLPKKSNVSNFLTNFSIRYPYSGPVIFYFSINIFTFSEEGGSAE